MSLHELLSTRRTDVLQRWKERVQGTLAPESLPSIELIDHFPKFLDEVLEVLREDASLSLPSSPPEGSATAAGHGEQRLRLGFSLDSVVREYGALRDAIVSTAQQADEPLTARETQIVFDCTITGIANAVSQYTLQRDTELVRHANEHFAFIAHELRNPLSAAAMAFHQLRMRGQLPTEGRTVKVLEQGLQRTSDLVDQTLRTARVASGIELRRARTSLRAVFDDAEMSAVAEAESKNIDLRTVLETPQYVNVDARLLGSAVGNLVRNAVKYSNPGGKVELRGSIANGRLFIEVEDSCGGLEPGKVEAAFAPFVRLDERQSGFGLGLAIARQAVDAHGGTIRVQNVPGSGCIFVLEMPA